MCAMGFDHFAFILILQLNVAYTGASCLSWASTELADYVFNDGTSSEASNYCRNPNLDDAGPWCYVDTADDADGWQMCDIPLCGEVPIETCYLK